MRSCEVSEGVKYRRSRPQNGQAIWLKPADSAGGTAYGVLADVNFFVSSASSKSNPFNFFKLK